MGEQPRGGEVGAGADVEPFDDHRAVEPARVEGLVNDEAGRELGAPVRLGGPRAVAVPRADRSVAGCSRREEVLGPPVAGHREVERAERRRRWAGERLADRCPVRTSGVGHAAPPELALERPVCRAAARRARWQEGVEPAETEGRLERDPSIRGLGESVEHGGEHGEVGAETEMARDHLDVLGPGVGGVRPGGVDAHGPRGERVVATVDRRRRHGQRLAFVLGDAHDLEVRHVTTAEPIEQRLGGASVGALDAVAVQLAVRAAEGDHATEVLGRLTGEPRARMPPRLQPMIVIVRRWRWCSSSMRDRSPSTTLRVGPTLAPSFQAWTQ